MEICVHMLRSINIWMHLIFDKLSSSGCWMLIVDSVRYIYQKPLEYPAAILRNFLPSLVIIYCSAGHVSDCCWGQDTNITDENSFCASLVIPNASQYVFCFDFCCNFGSTQEFIENKLAPRWYGFRIMLELARYVEAFNELGHSWLSDLLDGDHDYPLEPFSNFILAQPICFLKKIILPVANFQSTSFFRNVRMKCGSYYIREKKQRNQKYIIRELNYNKNILLFWSTPMVFIFLVSGTDWHRYGCGYEGANAAYPPIKSVCT